MLTGWILSLMVALQPEAPWKDTYPATAAAINQVVSAQPSIFTDDHEGRAKIASVLVALPGPSRHSSQPRLARTASAAFTRSAEKRDASDPLKASRVALDLVRESFRLCRARRVEERLAVYAAGGTSCKDPPALALSKSRFRIWKALVLVKQHPPPPPPLDVELDVDAGAPR